MEKAEIQSSPLVSISSVAAGLFAGLSIIWITAFVIFHKQADPAIFLPIEAGIIVISIFTAISFFARARFPKSEREAVFWSQKPKALFLKSLKLSLISLFCGVAGLALAFVGYGFLTGTDILSLLK